MLMLGNILHIDALAMMKFSKGKRKTNANYREGTNFVFKINDWREALDRRKIFTRTLHKLFPANCLKLRQEEAPSLHVDFQFSQSTRMLSFSLFPLILAVNYDKL
jgi:hypothetical protein